MMTRRFRARVGLAVCAILAVPAAVFLVFSGHAGGQVPGFPGQPGVIVGPTPTPTTAAAYIKFDGVDGEATDRDHRQWSDILSVSQGQYVPPSPMPGGRARAGCVAQEIVVTKALDKASPKLAEAVCRATVFPKVEIELTARYTDMGRVTYYAYELKNVQVTSYHVGTTAADPVPVEELTLNFEEIKVTYTETDNQGRSKGNVEYEWKVEEGES